MVKKIILILIGITLVVSSFYWFQYRPSRIRIECSKISSEKIVDRHVTSGLEFEAGYNAYYSMCLNSKGFSK